MTEFIMSIASYLAAFAAGWLCRSLAGWDAPRTEAKGGTIDTVELVDSVRIERQ